MASKITVIGGGSSTFVPQLMRLFIESRPLSGSTITLMDIDARRLEVMDRLCRLLVERLGADLTIESTCDQRASLVGADYVITAISVGGMDAWEMDIEIPARHGIYMAIADSIGPGGIMRAFRHIPVLAAVADDVRAVAPDAWVFNYSNPLSSIVTALRRHQPAVKTVGLCTCTSIPANAASLARWAGVEPADVLVPALGGGLNHCAFMVDVRLRDGSSAFPRMLAHVQEPVLRWGLETFGVLPYCWSHVTEFFPALSHLAETYGGRLQGLEMRYGIHVHAMEHERERAQRWERLVGEWTSGEGAGVSLDVLPSGEAVQVTSIIEALTGHGNALYGVNVPNQGAIDNLPADAIVEVTSVVGGYGIHPLHIGPLPEPLAAMLRAHITTQQLTAEAALSGDHRTALQAFMSDPQVQSRLELSQIPALLDEMLTAHRTHLPRFA